jgi:integrase
MKTKLKLTAANIRTLPLPQGKRDFVYRDSEIPGFCLRTRRDDPGKPEKRTLIFTYSRAAGTSKSPKLTIGVVGAIDISAARQRAKELYAEVMAGGDPLRDKAIERAAADQTFGAAVHLYLPIKQGEVRRSTYADIARHLQSHAKALHPIPLAQLERRSVATVVARVAEERGRPTGNRVHVSLNTFFVWCMGRGLIDHNPCSGIVRSPERARDRVLTRGELTLIWTAAGDDHFGCIVRLLMLTGQREAEIAKLRWSEISGHAILLSSARTKNHRSHTIPLSNDAAVIIDTQPRRLNDDGTPRDLIFGIGSGPFSGWGAAKARLDARIEKMTGKALDPWRIHDLRRSFVTHCAEEGIAQPHIIEAAINHVSGVKAGVAGVYNRATHTTEVRTLMDRWATWLLDVVEGRKHNVVGLGAYRDGGAR